MALIKRGQTFVSQRSGARCGCTSHAFCTAWCAVHEVYSDDEDDDDNERCDMEVKGCETELQLYIDSQKSDDVLRFWESKKSVFPRLYAITRQIFSVPATTAGVERLFSIAGYILNCRRLSLIDRNFEDQVFAHCNSDLLANASRKRKPDAD